MFSRVKGGDRTTAVLENEANEIQDYLDTYYLSTSEAVWHIFGFKLHHRSLAISQLQIHLLNQQTITLDYHIDIVTLLQNQRLYKTTLIEYFVTTEQAAVAIDNSKQLDFNCCELFYQEFPTHMI